MRRTSISNLWGPPLEIVALTPNPSCAIFMWTHSNVLHPQGQITGPSLFSFSTSVKRLDIPKISVTNWNLWDIGKLELIGSFDEYTFDNPKTLFKGLGIMPRRGLDFNYSPLPKTTDLMGSLCDFSSDADNRSISQQFQVFVIEIYIYW